MRELRILALRTSRALKVLAPASVCRHGTITVFDIPAGQDGRVWSLSNVDSNIPFRFLNLPTHFSFDAAHALTLR